MKGESRYEEDSDFNNGVVHSDECVCSVHSGVCICTAGTVSKLCGTVAVLRYRKTR